MRILYILLRIVMAYWGLILAAFVLVGVGSRSPWSVLEPIAMLSPVFHFWVYPSRERSRLGNGLWVACLFVSSFCLFAIAGKIGIGLLIVILVWFTALPLIAAALKIYRPQVMKWDFVKKWDFVDKGQPAPENSRPLFDY